jgi:hypothetical protein
MNNTLKKQINGKFYNIKLVPYNIEKWTIQEFPKETLCGKCWPIEKKDIGNTNTPNADKGQVVPELN